MKDYLRLLGLEDVEDNDMRDYLRALGLKEDVTGIYRLSFKIIIFIVYFFIGAIVNEKVFATYLLAIACSELIDGMKDYFYGDEDIEIETLLLLVGFCCVAVLMAVFICSPSFAESFFGAIGF